MDQSTASPVISTTLTIAVSVNTIASIVYAFVVFGFRSYAAKVTRLEDRLERQGATADAKQHELTNKLIDERMRGFTHDVADITNDLKVATTSFHMHVEETRRQMDRLGEKDHQAELKALAQIKDLQIEMARNAATKDDLKEHESSMRREMGELKKEVREEISRKVQA